MTIEEKRQYLGEYCCTSEMCGEDCPVYGKDHNWTVPVDVDFDCLDIAISPENDIDRAMEIVEHATGLAPNVLRSAIITRDEFTPVNDPVNHPSHYTDGKIEVIDFITDKKLGFCLGNAVKYIARAGKKDPSKTIEDLKKAIWYINHHIETLEEDYCND